MSVRQIQPQHTAAVYSGNAAHLQDELKKLLFDELKLAR